MQFDIAHRRRLGRFLLRCAAALFVAYGLLILVTQLDAWRYRRQAERLRDVMRSLSVGQSTWSDLQAIRKSWGKWGDYEGQCTSVKCDYTVTLGAPWSGGGMEGLVLHLGHTHFAGVMLRVVVKDGTVEHTSYSLHTVVPRGYGPRWESEEVAKYQMVPYSTGEHGYMLIARASQQAELDEYREISPVHPHYQLSRPSGCMGCLAIWTIFTSAASPVEKDRLTAFNFSCITRWVPCADEEDIMPDAGKEYLEQGRRFF